jgi:hypothetical protein
VPPPGPNVEPPLVAINLRSLLLAFLTLKAPLKGHPRSQAIVPSNSSDDTLQLWS